MRLLKKEEIDLIKALLIDKRNTKHLIDQLPHLMVEEMNDGGMGSLKFICKTDKQQIFGGQLAEMSIPDSDGIPVSFALNIDSEGNLYELDVFKGDFSRVKKIPVRHITFFN